MRCYWEGGYRGEGLIQELKSIINHGLTNNWQHNTMKRFFNLRTLSILSKETNFDKCHESEETSPNKEFKRYGTIDNIISTMMNHKPLSIIESKKNYFLVAIHSNQSIQICLKTFNSTISHMDYFSWKLMPDIVIHTTVSTDIFRHCILLPCLDKEINWVNYGGDVSGIYSCIDSDWNELTNKNGFVIPRKIEYDDIF